MERKKSVIIHMLQRILFPGIFITLLICSFALPASAANIDYNDLISNIEVDGDNDLVTITVPSDYILTQIVDGGTGESLVTNSGVSASYSVNSGYPYTIIFYAFQNGTDHLLLENIPNFTFVDYDFSISSPSGLGYETPSVFSDWYYFDAASQYISMSRTEHGNQVLTGNHSYTQFISKAPGTVSGSCNFTFYHLKPLSSGELTVRLKSLTLTFTISSLYRLQQETGKTNTILKEVEKQLADQGKTLGDILGTQQQTNNKLDGLWGSITDGFSSMGDKLNDLFTGGSAGDNVSGSAGDFKDQLGDVEDFQSGVESDLEAGFDEVLDFSGLASLAPAFAFIGTYVNKIWYDMDGLQIVFVLAFGIGAFLQLAQHTPRVPALRSQDGSSRGAGGRNSNWYDPVSGRVVDGNRERGQARVNRHS